MGDSKPSRDLTLLIDVARFIIAIQHGLLNAITRHFATQRKEPVLRSVSAVVFHGGGEKGGV